MKVTYRLFESFKTHHCKQVHYISIVHFPRAQSVRQIETAGCSCERQRNSIFADSAFASFGQCLRHILLRYINQCMFIKNTYIANGITGKICMVGYRAHDISRPYTMVF